MLTIYQKYVKIYEKCDIYIFIIYQKYHYNILQVVQFIIY